MYVFHSHPRTLESLASCDFAYSSPTTRSHIAKNSSRVDSFALFARASSIVDVLNDRMSSRFPSHSRTYAIDTLYGWSECGSILSCSCSRFDTRCCISSCTPSAV